MRKHNLAFIDLETTGLDPVRHEIIEIGCLLVRQTPQLTRGPAVEVISELDLKVKPEHLETADPEALRINRYNETDWLFAVELKQALTRLNELADNAIMVGQNVNFDWEFLRQAFQQTGLSSRLHHYRIDLMTLAFARLYHQTAVKKWGLPALAEYFGLQNQRSHSAMADIKLTFEIYKKLLEL